MELRRVHERVSSLEDGEGKNFSQLCASSLPDALATSGAQCESAPRDCRGQNVLTIIGLDRAGVLEALSQEEINARFIAAAASSCVNRSLGVLIADFALDATAHTINASALRFVYELEGVNEERGSALVDMGVGIRALSAREKRLADLHTWEKAFIRLLGVGVSVEGVQIQRIASLSYNAEVARQTKAMTPLMVGAFGLMIGLLAFGLLGGKPPIDSRVLLGLGGLATILLAVVNGYGWGAFLGVPFSVFSQVLSFIVMGVGLDDIIVLVDTL